MTARFAIVGRMTSVYNGKPKLASAVYHLQKLFQERVHPTGNVQDINRRWIMCRFPREDKVKWMQDDAHFRFLSRNLNLSKEMELELKASARLVMCQLEVEDGGLGQDLSSSFAIRMDANFDKFGIFRNKLFGMGWFQILMRIGIWWDQTEKWVPYISAMDRRGEAKFPFLNPLRRLRNVRFSLIPRDEFLRKQTLHEASRVVRFMGEARGIEQSELTGWKNMIISRLAGLRQPVGEIAGLLDVSFETKPLTFVLDGHPLAIPADPGDIHSWLAIGMVDKSG